MKNILNLSKPIIALSPMDGVTDAPNRFIIKKYGDPDLIVTEFVHVHGLCVAGDNLLHSFYYDESERPIIAQIYGKEPEYFYHAAKVLCALGFEGVDINMGCPARNVASSGAGAGLIRTPDLALEIIASVKKGVEDWVANGELTGLSERTQKAVDNLIRDYKERLFNLNISKEAYTNGQRNLADDNSRTIIPVSVKTRIGYDTPITEKWISTIDKADPAWISVHGRTLKQLYTGNANWDELKIAVASTDKAVLVNGDIKTKEDLEHVLDLTGAYGALIGRATYGTPWIFPKMRGEDISKFTVEYINNIVIEHTKKFVEIYPEPKLFFQMRKHLGWYIKDFPGASELRGKLVRASSLEEVMGLVDSK